MRFCLTYPLHNIYTETYSDISDQDLDQLLRHVQQQHPGVAIRLLKGHLGSIGHRIHGDRIQLSLLRTDPTGVLNRWKVSVKRWVYNVHAPQSLWHIDGNDLATEQERQLMTENGAERTIHIGQASCLICTCCHQLTFLFCCFILFYRMWRIVVHGGIDGYFFFFKGLFQITVCHPEYGVTREEKTTMLVGLCYSILIGDQVVEV